MLNILLVDDDREDQVLFMEAMNTLSISAHCKLIADGQKALDHLDAGHKYDIIFLDLNMPGITGQQCLQEMKFRKPPHDIPVVIFTTSKNPAHLKACNELGIKSYWNKPAGFKELCDGLYNILAEKN